MTTAYSPLLGLALPVQGELSGTWGDTVNKGLTDYLDIAVAGTLVLSGDGDVTLTQTNGDASATNIGSTTAQYAILRITGTLTTTKVITAPSSSKTYTVINDATGGAVTIKASGQPGVTIPVGDKAYVAFNGTDFVRVGASAGGSNNQVQYNSGGNLAGSANFTFDGTIATIDTLNLTNKLGVAQGGTGLATLTANNVILGNGTSTPTFVAPGTAGNVLTSNGTTFVSQAPEVTLTATQTLTNKTLTTPSINNSATVGGSVRLLEASNNGTNFVALKAPDTIASDVTYTLPGADGTNGQTLVTNGSGGLSWASGPAGGTNITAGNSNVTVTDTGSDGRVTITTEGAERARIDSSGVLGVGSTNPSATARRQYITGPGYAGNGSGVTGSTLPQLVIDGLSCDNSGSVNTVGVSLIGGGGAVPRGLIIGTYGNGRNTTKDTMLFASNTSARRSTSGIPSAGAYRGPLSATFAPDSWATAVGNGGMTSFGVYDNNPGDTDSTTKAGIQVQLAGDYSGGSPGRWGGYCYTAKIDTNFGSGSNGTNFGYYADITGAGSGNNWGIYIANGNAAKPGGGSWTATSDARVKTVLSQYSRGLAEVMQLQPIDFEYNGKGGHSADGKRYTGVIAQDLQLVMPEMISSRLAKLNDADEEETSILMVDNSSLVYALVNAVKELNAKVEALTAEVNTLKGA